MARSTLPPIVWVASCGHQNEVRSDHGGYPAKCKTCGAGVWVPKRGAGRAPSAHEAAGRFVSRHQAAARTRTADRPPRHAGFGDEADAEATEEAARRDLAIAQAAAAAVARMAGRQPAGGPGSGALNGVPIPPSRLPAPQPAKPKPVLLVRAEPTAPVRREQRGPGFGEYLVPEAGPWCEVCSFMGWRNHEGLFARATVALETLRDGRILVCGNCTARIRKRFPGEMLSAQKLPGQPRSPGNGAVYRAVPYRLPDPVSRAAIPDRQPNPTMEISGRGREGQLALARAGQPPVFRRASSSLRCSCRGPMAGPGHQPGCVFSTLAAPLTAWG
jgi:hypothetical protein